jgi:hypothetical protein
VTEPAGRTPDAPDVDQPDGGAHTGPADSPEDEGRTPAAPDVDQPDGGAHTGN